MGLLTPPPRLLPVLEKTKQAYVAWYDYCLTLPKTHRYTLGQKVDELFVHALEAIVTASFLSKQEKLPYVRMAIRKIDTIKVFLMMLWETKSLESKKYISLSLKIDEAGRMLGGWQGSLIKENSLTQKK